MATLGSLVATMELQSAQFTRGFQQAARAMNSQTAQMRQQTRLLNQNFGQMQKGIDGVRNSLNLAKVAFAALGLGAFVREVFRSATSFEAIENGLKAATGSATGAAREFQFVRAEVERLGLDLESSAKNFTSLTAAARGTALEGQAARDIFTAVSSAMVVLGRNADETRGAMIAIEQMISKGNVSAEELRQQLGERLPGAFQLAARAMGVTTQELNKMLQLGEVTAAEMLPALASELNKTFGAGLESATTGALAQMNRFRSTVFELKTEFARSGFIDGLLEGLTALRESLQSESFRNAARDLGEALGKAMTFTASVAVLLANNLDLVLSVLGGIIALKAAVFFGNLAAAVQTVVAAALSLNVALLANPITAVAAAIGLATVAAIYFREKTIELGNVSFRTGDILVGVWTTIQESIQGVIQGASALLEVMFQISRGDMAAAWEAAKEASQGYGQAIRSALTGWEAFKASARDRTVGDALSEISSLAFDFEKNAERAALSFSGLAAGLGDVGDATDKLGGEMSEAEKKAQSLREAIHGIKLSDTISQINNPAWQEFAETLDQIGVKFEVIAGKEIDQIEVLDYDQLELANALFDAIQQGGRHVQEMARKSADFTASLQDQVDQQALLLRFGGEETAEYRSQLRLMEAKRALGGDLNAQQLELLATLDQQSQKLEEQQKLQEFAASSDLMLEPFRNAIRGIQDSFTDMFEDIFSGGVDSFSDLADSIKRIFIRLAAEIATLMVIRPVLAGALGGGGITGLGGLLGGAAAGINRFGTNFGFAGAPIGPTANPFGGNIGGFQFGQPGGLSGQTLTGFLGAGATGAAIGGVGSSLFGVSGAGQTGATIGGALGGAVGSIIPGVGTIIGSVAGSVLGGLVGGMFGGKPSDKGQVSQIDLMTNAVKEWGQTGEKFSQENRDAATTFAGAAIQLSDTLKALTGGTISGGLKIHVGSRDALRLFRGDDLVGRTTDPKQFIALITKTIADAVVGGSAIQQQVLRRADRSSPEALLRDVEFGRQYEQLIRPTTQLREQVSQLKQQFAETRGHARRLGLNLGVLNDAQKKAEEGIRRNIMDSLRALAGESTGFAASVGAVRQEFRAVRNEFGKLGIGLNLNEINALQKRAEASMRQGIMEPLRELAGRGTSEFIQSMKEIEQRFGAVRAEFGKLGLGLNIQEINRLEQQAKAGIRDAFMSQLQGFVEGTQTFADQIATLRDRFADARREARVLGIDIAEIRELEAKAIRNLAGTVVADLEGQISQQARAIREHFRGILDPLRNFRSSLDFGPLSANAPAQQFQLAQSQFQLLARQAANNNAQALRDLPSAAQAFIQQAEAFNASVGKAEAVAQVQRAFDAAISQQERMESEFTRDLPDAIDDSADKQVKALRQEVDRLVAAVNEVTREMQRNQKRVA